MKDGSGTTRPHACSTNGEGRPGDSNGSVRPHWWRKPAQLAERWRNMERTLDEVSETRGMKTPLDTSESESPRRPRPDMIPVDEVLARLRTLHGSKLHRRERLIDFAERLGLEPERIDGYLCLPREIFDKLESDGWQL